MPDSGTRRSPLPRADRPVRCRRRPAGPRRTRPHPRHAQRLTAGRLLARIDGDALDDAVGTWLARHAADPVEEDEALVGLAVDGETVRGSRTGSKTAIHLLAAALHGSQTVIAQRRVAAKRNEIPAFAPLPARFDLRGVVVTADAMHTQRKTAKKIVSADGHYILVVKGNPKKLRRQLRSLPWRQMPLLDRTRIAGHGRREVRRLKVCTVGAGLRFPSLTCANGRRRLGFTCVGP